MQIQVKLIAKGKVQKVGYRDIVQDIARGLNINGEVKNLKSGDVEIIAEGEERDIEKFKKAIKIKDDIIDAKEVIEVSRNKYSGKYKYFEIISGSIEEELREGLGAGTRYVKENLNISKENLNISKENLNISKEILKETKIVGDKVDNLTEEVKTVSEKMDINIQETKSFAKELSGKYHTISQDAKIISDNIIVLVKSVVSLVEKVAESNERIAKLIEYFINKEKREKNAKKS